MTGLSSAALFALLTACNGSTDDPETGETGDPSLPPCETPLALSPAEATVNPYGITTLTATGGTGAYLFTLSSNENGSEMQLETGTFVAGNTENVTEQVNVADEGCEGSATADVHIVPLLSVSPEVVRLPPDTDFTWSVSGGSGEVEWEYFQNESGGSLDDLNGTTGTSPGHDIIYIRDLKTDDVATIRLYVEENASFGSYAQQYIIPLGSDVTPEMIGGSGIIDATLLSGDIEVDDQRFVGTSAGVSTVRLTDRYVPTFSTTIHVTVSAPMGYDTEEAGGLARQQNSALGPGDLNGDGYPDAILGNQELHLGGYATGGVLIYEGGPDGLEPVVAQTISAAVSNQRFGFAMAVEDFDGDGQQDLAVSAPYTNGTSVSNGAIYIYLGVEGGFFESEPNQVLMGTYGYDRLGHALDSCDLNGDGRPELIATAYLAEDRAALNRTYGQGAAHIFLGSKDGLFADEPDASVWGKVLKDGVWTGIENMYFGTSLVTGDFNGDNQCDFAVGGYNWANDGEGKDGGVFVYSGLESEPYFHAVYEQTQEYGEFGRSLAVADFDLDGADELVVGAQRGADTTTMTGSAYVFWVSEQDDPTRTVFADEAEWRMFGDSNYSYFSKGLSTADVSGDGVPDLIISATQDEISGGASNTGVTIIMDGSALVNNSTSGPYDATNDTPTHQFVGETGTDRFGQTFTPLGDVNHDSSIDFMAYAATDSSLGVLIGAPYFINGSDEARYLLDMPIIPAGANIGYQLAFYNDGTSSEEDLFIGAPYTSHPDRGTQSGIISSHLADGEQWSPLEDQVWQIDAYRNTGRYGWDLTSIGDFNNDSYPDMAFLSRGHSRTDVSSVSEPGDCTFKGSGAVYIHLGSASGLSPTPAFRIQAPTGYNYLTGVAGDFDFDGDGYDDIVLTNYSWDGSGGFVLVQGRDASNTGEILGLCDGLHILGQQGDEDLGFAVTPLGDIDGDNRDELVITAKDQNEGISRQGLVWVLWGTPSPKTQLYSTALGSQKVNSYLGTAAAGGKDIDGDTIPDVVVGSYNYNYAGNSVGGVWLISGAYINSLPRESSQNKLPTEPTVHPHVPDGDISYALFGTQAGADFGFSLALIKSPNAGEAHWVGIGSRFGSSSKTLGGGKAEVYRWTPNIGFEATPRVLIASESGDYGGYLGHAITGGTGSPVIAVGGIYSHAIGYAQGAAYAATLQPTEAP